MVTIVSAKTQFGDHEDSNFSEGLRRSQKVSEEEQTALQKGVTPKNGEGAELGKLKQMLKGKKEFLKYFLAMCFARRRYCIS